MILSARWRGRLRGGTLDAWNNRCRRARAQDAAPSARNRALGPSARSTRTIVCGVRAAAAVGVPTHEHQEFFCVHPTDKKLKHRLIGEVIGRHPARHNPSGADICPHCEHGLMAVEGPRVGRDYTFAFREQCRSQRPNRGSPSKSYQPNGKGCSGTRPRYQPSSNSTCSTSPDGTGGYPRSSQPSRIARVASSVRD